ncbi:MAG TPA: HAD domain-containing protein, partial [Gammaproteobacteria bacterium]|nr:HAD domain-containing protein [Gammaproteobacteria bacterium]
VTLTHVGAMLDRAGWDDAPLVDVTPSAPQLGYDVSRADEVRAWVQRHLNDRDRWVALDDSWSDPDDAHVVHVDPQVGLTGADAVRARRMLQGG